MHRTAHARLSGCKCSGSLRREVGSRNGEDGHRIARSSVVERTDHGTALLSRDPDLVQTLVEWFQQTLGVN